MIKLNADPVFLFYKLHKLKDGKLQEGAPIPVYLSQNITGICVDNEEDSLSISTDYIPVLGEQKSTDNSIKVQQRGESRKVRITLIASKNSVGLNILLPLMKSILSYAFAQKEYKIAYFNQNVLIFNARLAGYQMIPGSDDTKVSITVTLEVLPDKEDEEKRTYLEHSSEPPQTGVVK